jgi:serine/threonine-protein kinase
MESHDGLELEVLWGLLAEQNQFITSAALAGALEAWRDRAGKSLAQIVLEQSPLDPVGADMIESLRKEYLNRLDHDPLGASLPADLDDALERLLKRVPDSNWRSRVRQAAKSVGIHGSNRASDSTIKSRQGERVGSSSASDTVGTVAEDERSGGTAKGSGLDQEFMTSGQLPTTRLETPSAPSDLCNTEALSPGLTEPTQQAPDSNGERTTPLSSDDDQTKVQQEPASAAESSLRYRVVRPLAHGGLGSVSVAHDEELHREVALKEILGRHAQSMENRMRFVLEAEVTGGLEHPGIVPVYGLGEYRDGRPYYAMRLVRGESLQSAITRFHKAEGPSRDPGERELSLRHLLTHFVDICEAIAYAHSRGVLHRDLKPANVMLGKFGETLVVDWGVAKPLGKCFVQQEVRVQVDPLTLFDHVLLPAEPDPANAAPLTSTLAQTEQASPSSLPPTEAHVTPFVPGSAAQENPQDRPLIPNSLRRSSHTLAGSRVGTPSFMSPEQAAGHVDQLGPASDIYSLGATLYNILTGKPPVTGTDLPKTLTRVVAGDFPLPRMVARSVPRPLEAIVMKAMALKPENRYATAKALGDDIEHWMAGEPVSAYRDPWPRRLARWAQRHKTAVAAAAGLLLATLAGLVSGSILLERERARTDRERKLAVKNYRYAYDAAETMLSRVGDRDLADIPQMEPVRLELLGTAKLQFQKLLEQQSEDPEILLLEGRTRARLGGVLEMMGRYGDAERDDREAIASFKSLSDRFPSDDRPTAELARAEHGLGVLLRKLNRFREAETALREAVRLREQLAARFPTDHELTKALADSRYHLGALLARLVSPQAEDKALYAQAIKDQTLELSLDPKAPENRVKLAQYLNNLAILEARTDASSAERDYRKILELLAGLDPIQSSLPGARWQGARASNNLAVILLENQHRDQEAEGLWNRARGHLGRLTAEFPRIVQYRRELASIFNNLGRLALDREGRELAAESFRHAAELLEGLVAADPQVPDYQQNLSLAKFQLELLRAAAGAGPASEDQGLERILADQEGLIAGHPEVPDYRNALARNLLEYGKLLLNLDDATRALPLAEKAIARSHEAVDADPGNRNYIRNHYDALVLRMLIAIKMKDIESIASFAERLVEVRGDDLKAYLTAAMGLASCVELNTNQEQIASEAHEQAAESHGRRAVELLRQAIDRNLLRSVEPLRDAALIPLRSRQDFIDLVKQLHDRQIPVNG